MQLELRTPAKTLTKAHARQSVRQEELERFKIHLAALLAHLNSNEDEEHLKNFVRDFLLDTWYRPTNLVNTSDRIDLAIYSGKSSADPKADVSELEALVDEIVKGLYGATGGEVTMVTSATAPSPV
jgi:hypothetical protein